MNESIRTPAVGITVKNTRGVVGINLLPSDLGVNLQLHKQDKPPTVCLGVYFKANDREELLFLPETFSVEFCNKWTEEVNNVFKNPTAGTSLIRLSVIPTAATPLILLSVIPTAGAPLLLVSVIPTTRASDLVFVSVITTAGVLMLSFTNVY